MAARAERRPPLLSELFPESRLQEIATLLGDDNKSLQSLKSFLKDEQSHVAHHSTPQHPEDVSTPECHSSEVPDKAVSSSPIPPEAPSNPSNEWHDALGRAWSDPDEPHSSQTQGRATLRHPEDVSAPGCHGFGVLDKAVSSSPTPHEAPSDPATPDDTDEWYMPPAEPFPITTLPQPIQQFVTEQSRSLNCDLAAIALPVLSVLASALGGNKRIHLKQGVSEPAILWTAVVREGMAAHDPILEAALAPLRGRQARAFQQQQSVMLKYQHRLAAFRTNQRSYPDGTYPPVEPLAERTLTVDWTLPSLSRLLTKQARGLLICPLELDDWLSKSTGSGVRAAIDRQAWFDLHAGRSVMIEHRTPLHLSSAAVSVTGTLSAEVLSRRLTKSPIACGMTGRLLFAAPTALPPCWTDDEVDPATIEGYTSVVEKLFSLSTPTEPTPNAVSPKGEPQFVIPLNGVPSDIPGVTLSPEARNTFAEFVTDLGARQEQIDEALFAWTSNLPSQAARLALVIHESRWAAGEQVDPNICDQDSLRSAIVLTRWFIAEAQRFLQKQYLTSEQRDLQQLYDWLERRRSPASPRDVCRHNGRKYPTVELATAALNKLAATGLTRWTETPSGPQGGRPTRKLDLRQPPKQSPKTSPRPTPPPELCHTHTHNNPPTNPDALEEWHVPESSKVMVPQEQTTPGSMVSQSSTKPHQSGQSHVTNNQSPVTRKQELGAKNRPPVPSDKPSKSQNRGPKGQRQTSPRQRLGNRTNTKPKP